MKAFGKKRNINDRVMQLEVPRPKLGAQELLVKVEAIGVGVHDEYFHPPNVEYPYVIGIEGAGTVEQVGNLAGGYSVSDRVAFVSMMQPKGGTWAEYAAVSSESLVLPIPDGMSFKQAAAIPVAGNTALKIMHAAELGQGGSMFISGGAGAIGTLLIQIAKARGVTVISSASAKNHSYLKGLGTDYEVDYHESDWQHQVRDVFPDGVDVAVGIHPGTPSESQAVVRDGGIVIAVSGDQVPTERGIILKGVFNNVDVHVELREMMQSVVEGVIQLTIARVFPFDQALQALDQVKTRRTRGKLVISNSID